MCLLTSESIIKINALSFLAWVCLLGHSICCKTKVWDWINLLSVGMVQASTATEDPVPNVTLWCNKNVSLLWSHPTYGSRGETSVNFVINRVWRSYLCSRHCWWIALRYRLFLECKSKHVVLIYMYTHSDVTGRVSGMLGTGEARNCLHVQWVRTPHLAQVHSPRVSVTDTFLADYHAASWRY